MASYPCEPPKQITDQSQSQLQTPAEPIAQLYPAQPESQGQTGEKETLTQRQSPNNQDHSDAQQFTFACEPSPRRKRGRPLGSKNKPKPADGIAQPPGKGFSTPPSTLPRPGNRRGRPPGTKNKPKPATTGHGTPKPTNGTNQSDEPRQLGRGQGEVETPFMRQTQYALLSPGPLTLRMGGASDGINVADVHVDTRGNECYDDGVFFKQEREGNDLPPAKKPRAEAIMGAKAVPLVENHYPPASQIPRARAVERFRSTRLGPSMTLEEAVRLLPDKLLGIAPLWGADNETRLQESWSSLDQQLLEQQSKANSEEQSLWKMMLHLFGCHLYDLFRYGLRFDDCDPEEATTYGTSTIWLSKRMCRSLQGLLSHPIWHGNLDALRFALQTAICHRVEGHIQPISRWNPTEEEQEILEDISGSSPVERTGAHFYLRWYPGSIPEIKRLCNMIQEIASQHDTTDPRLPRHPQEKTLFLLQQADVKVVISALDNMQIYGEKIYSLPCQALLSAYRDVLPDEKWQEFHPRTLETVIEWKKEYALANRRDWIISKRYWRDGIRPDPKVPHFEPWDVPSNHDIPIHVSSQLLGFTPEHVEMMRGTIWPFCP
ncbi:hypothetical protein B0T19DRAFT_428927 [Cercophora scortea]|uniref:Uncharacterized protein n=1 Tax=Cercophora scortea TaxID=314031 RepID=A0AAE0IG75_9PEZI|nr:hypothetical protein B0T19DRAFT_428927 [Cercophora scortea]